MKIAKSVQLKGASCPYPLPGAPRLDPRYRLLPVGRGLAAPW